MLSDSGRRQHPHRRRKKGDKSKNAKVAFVGAVCTLLKTDDGFEGPINKRLVATFESHEAAARADHISTAPARTNLPHPCCVADSAAGLPFESSLR